jgi:fucose permease
LTDKTTKRVWLVGSNLFFTLGMLAALGPTLPEIARNTGSSLADAGILFTALFLGAVPAQLVSGWLNDKYGSKPVLAVGLVVMSIGFLGATLSPTLPIAVAFMLFGGLGDGALIVAGNVMVAQTFATKSASALNLMNVFYGVGAIAGPALVGLTISVWQTSLPPLWLISLLMALLLIGVAGLPGKRVVEPKAEDNTELTTAPAVPQRPFFLSPVLWIMSIVLFLYVAVEVGMGGWASEYMQQSTNLVPETAAFVASAFYVALTGGRLIGAWVGNRMQGTQLLLACVTVSVAGALFMLLSVGNTPVSIFSIMLLGLALGPVYPTVMAVVTQRFSTSAGVAASIVIAAGSLGGTFGPLIQGKLLAGQGANSYAQSVLVSTLTMLVLLTISMIVSKRRAQAREVEARTYQATAD